jgi:hypothetical protein
MDAPLTSSLADLLHTGPTKIVMNPDDFKTLQKELTAQARYAPPPPPTPSPSGFTGMSTLFGVEVSVSSLIPKGKAMFYGNKHLSSSQMVTIDPKATALVLSGPYNNIDRFDDNEDGTWDAFDKEGMFVMALPKEAVESIQQAKGW